MSKINQPPSMTPGPFILDFRFDASVSCGDPMIRLNAAIDWERFRRIDPYGRTEIRMELMQESRNASDMKKIMARIVSIDKPAGGASF
jgi:hypothetical protein